MKEIITLRYSNYLKQEVSRILIYGYKYLSDLEYRKKIINKIRNDHVKQKMIAKHGRKEYNRRTNYRVSVKERILKDNEYGYCKMCRKKKERKELSADHIIPLRFGGKHEKLNIQLLCKECHLAKTHKDNGTKPKSSLSTTKS